ncbi:putative glycerol transporter protein [Chaetomidium leptoderma]|uniref:Glycerol transporter protein n=1 Tax=Chaetomidium leptoderma TaxID=669021 RepID=A0AAN6VIM2_9PEZI|nr:putative glycerol transporter protein [Chaetomidium leptoderma]
MNSAESNPDLESFREQWRAEVRAKHVAPGSSGQQQQQQRATAGPSATQPRTAPVTGPKGKPLQTAQKSTTQEHDDDYAPSQPFDEPAATAPESAPETAHPEAPEKGEPRSALEHYEKAVEKEVAGNLGDSLRLYRKAFRMDDAVDQKYRNKHFPKPPPKSTQAAPPPGARTSTSSAPTTEQPQSMKDLIASFSVVSIAPAPPEVEGMPPPPCPLASLPEEILVHILRDVAILDIGDFMRLARVCKRLAYLVATEDRIWRRICLGTEFGFGGMHYYWQRQVAWGPISVADLVREANEAEEAAAPVSSSGSGSGPVSVSVSVSADSETPLSPPLTLSERAHRHAEENAANTLAFYQSVYSRSWQRMFRLRPRIRFNGCYISTVNYMRSGQASHNQVTWNSPVHIVTYYRYLRFFRDGSAISLLTTAEPADVVHHLTRDAVALHAGGANPHLPSAVAKEALKGRWRLAREADNPGTPLSEVEGDVIIETEGQRQFSTMASRANSGRRSGPLSFLTNLYDLDTLDTRFTTPSSVPYRAANDKREDDNNKTANKQAEPSKWNTPEFYFYTVVLSFVVPYMFWIAYRVSRPSDPRYHKFEPWLQDGWIPGRKIDVSDAQYRTFRMNVPYMALLLLFHPLLRRVWNVVYPLPQEPKAARANAPEAAEARLRQRTSFDRTFAVIYLVALHGFSAVKILTILAINYKLATGLPKKYIPPVTWVFNICILFANEICKGFKFRDMALLATGTPVDTNMLVALGEWLDSYGGIMRRWEILFNITVLRLVSFNLDYYWSLDRRGSSPIEKKQLDPANLSERDRVATPASPQDFSFGNYLAYTIYAPLYLTGPIITFNDYISQQRYQPATLATSRTVKYAIRFALTLLAMELVLHFDYVGAISKARPEWHTYSPAELSLLSYFNLHIIWLKLLVPWRFFRLWALADGVDPPENMLRCVSNNYSTLSFWRGWHRSYYRWLLRYIYIPLGGSSFRTWPQAVRTVVTYLVVFTFVALWHDIKMHLLIWGWLIVVFFLPEIAAGILFPRKKWEARPTAYRMLCCVGGVLNVLLMMSANLVGFAVGLDGLETIVRGIFRDYSGLAFLLTACVVLFMGIQVMFEIRQSELRRGINLKC